MFPKANRRPKSAGESDRDRSITITSTSTGGGWGLFRGWSVPAVLMLAALAVGRVHGQPVPAPTPAPTAAPAPAPTIPPAPAPTATPIPVATIAPVVTPAPGAPPEVLMESATTPAEVGGAVPAAAGEALPQEEPESPTATLLVKEMDIERAFDRIREQSGVVVKAKGKVAGVKVSVAIQNAPVEQILTTLAGQNNWVWVEQPPGEYSMYDQETYVAEVLGGQRIRKVFQLDYINAEELNEIITPILTPQIGTSSADLRTNRLIVSDLPDKIYVIEDIISEFDVQLYTQVFEIQNANAEDIADRLDEIASESAEIQVDPVNRIIVVKDTFQRLKMMEQLVALLDRDQELRIYYLNNMGLDGAIAQEIVDRFIEPLITEEAVLEFNIELGRLVLKDVRPVHEKVIELLKALDAPRKQVLIEGELLSVQMTNNLAMGTAWEFSPDLAKAQELDVPGISNDPESQEGLPAFFVDSAGLRVLHLTDTVRMELSAALTDSNTRLLMRPRLLIASGEDGTFTVGEQQPVLQTFINDNSNSDFRSNSQSLVTTGLTVEITPFISNRGLIEMEIYFDNSTPIIVPDIGNGQRGVGANTTNATTYMIVPSGETRVIGGLISRDRKESNTGVPVLAKIPYLGFLFGQKNNDETLRNLMFFVKATIVEEPPQSDVMVMPVNEEARVSMAEVADVALPPADVNRIPPELEPYLQSIRPEALPMPEDEMGAATMADDAETTPRLGAAAAGAGRSLLRNDGWVDPGAPELLRSGGAVQSALGAAGPSGSFGAQQRPVIGRRPAPAVPPMTPALPGGAMPGAPGGVPGAPGGPGAATDGRAAPVQPGAPVPAPGRTETVAP